jgi:predicted AAA+ superfamily ATPase
LFGYTDNFGPNFENFIYWNLKKKFEKIFYKSNGQEVDFFIPEKNMNIQVVYDLNEKNFEREILPLKKQEGEKILVYFDKVGNYKDTDVKIVSFIDFLSQLRVN